MAEWIKVQQTTTQTAQAVNDGTGAIEWQVNRVEPVSLTGRELQALRNRVPVKSLNMQCATDVKRWILQGMTLTQMEFQGKGRKGYGARMLKYYHAALAPLLPKK